LGENGKKSYLILFQNNAEIRPGGGFLGSFARIDFEDGKLLALDFEKNIYTLDKAYAKSGKAPEPPIEYQNFIDTWTMRDSNVYADFRESAKKVSWFFKQEAGKDVDGVIAIDTTLFRQLLKLTGPIEMTDYNMTVTADNFLSDVQYQVEVGYFEDKNNWSENQPKKILADMLPKFLNRLFSSADSGKFAIEIANAIEEKHLLVYLENERLQDLISGVNLSGEIKNASGDYLYLSDSNIGGKKSSLNIDLNVYHQVEVLDNGNTAEKITIFRKHNGTYDWPDGENKNYVKILLPLIAKIQKVEILNVTETEHKHSASVEFDKTAISFWQNTKPGEESKSMVSYTRENGLNDLALKPTFQNLIQKQPGIEEFDYHLSLKYPQGWRPENVENYDENERLIDLNFKIRKDTSFSVRFVRSETK